METLKTIYREHAEYRKQISVLAKSELIKTYSGTAFGWAWAVIKPASTLFIFWFCFTVGLRSGKPVEGYPYFLYLMAGFVSWFFMSDCLSGGAMCIRRQKHLVTKMKFPMSTIPTFFCLSELYVHMVLVLITVVVFALFGYFPDIYYLQILFYMALMFISFVIWGLFAGIICCFSRDFKNLISSLTRAIFWMSGVFFNINRIEHEWIRVALKLNPIAVIVAGYRNCFIYKKWFFEEPTDIICFAISNTILFFLAVLAFKKLRKEVPDVI